uniref:Uncharacterized protein n=1 Tax=Arundo donax TaxID=35708 RepID=A0A0A9HH45_ARUDO
MLICEVVLSNNFEVNNCLLPGIMHRLCAKCFRPLTKGTHPNIIGNNNNNKAFSPKKVGVG